MTIEQAITKAIEGGWNKESIVQPMDTGPANLAKAILDPSFWQSLGKAMGWNKLYYTICHQKVSPWLFHWHRLIDHLADGGSIESYFEKL